MASTICPSVRQSLHRDPPRRDRPPCPDHPRQRRSLHLGRARGDRCTPGDTGSGRLRSGDDLTGTAGPRRHDCQRRRATEPSVARRAAHRATRLRAHPDNPALPAGIARLAVAVDDVLLAEQLSPALPAPQPRALVGATVNERTLSLLSNVLFDGPVHVRRSLTYLRTMHARALIMSVESFTYYAGRKGLLTSILCGPRSLCNNIVIPYMSSTRLR